MQEAQINATLDEARQTWQRQKPITDHLKDRYTVQQIWEIDDYQIAKVKRRNDKSGEVIYVTYINYVPTNEMGMTLDHAILICMAHKYNAGYMFPLYTARMLNASFAPEIE